MVELTLVHHYNGGTNTVPPLGELKLTLGTKMLFFMLAAPLQRCNMVGSTIVMVGYKDIVMLAAHPLIGRPLLNNWAGVSGRGNRFNTRWRPN